MKKLLCSVVIVSLALVLTVRAQERPTTSAAATERPNFAGAWVLVPDKSTPATAQHQPDVTITQEGSTVSLTRKATVYSSQPGQPPSAATADRQDVIYVMPYVCDALEHPTPTPQMPGMPAGGMTMSSTTVSTYRAIWTRDQLVIVTYQVNQPDRNGFSARRMSRLALTLSSDGLLTMESMAVVDPAPGAPTQPTPAPIRGVYKKAS